MQTLFYLFVLISYTFGGLIIKPAANNSPDISKRFVYISDEEGKTELIDLLADVPTVQVEPADIKFYLYTQKNPENPSELTNCDITQLSRTDFDATKRIFFITHGWHNDHSSSINTHIREAIINNFDVNVFVVDWSSYSQSLYLTAKGAVSEVGKLLGQFINEMQTNYGLQGTQFELVGHSLGAHVSGNAGAIVTNKIAVIVGLDPAKPLFSESDTTDRLDPSDATFVEVIHTSGLILGFDTSIGHADFYPNGGNRQPGCGLDVTGDCAHGRSFLYFAESIERGEVFIGTKCADYDAYSDGKCSSNSKSAMGLIDVVTSASGDYFLDTNEESPYGQG